MTVQFLCNHAVLILAAPKKSSIQLNSTSRGFNIMKIPGRGCTEDIVDMRDDIQWMLRGAHKEMYGEAQGMYRS